MKQILVPKPDITIKHKFNEAKQQSLKILSCNNDELRIYLNEQMNSNPYLNYSYENNHDIDTYLTYDVSRPSLYDEIMEQVGYSKYKTNNDICEYLLSCLDSNGYFKCSYQTLLKNAPYSPQEIKRHIAILRTMEPHGLFAFDLKDCMQIQCKLAKQEIAFTLCSYLEALALSQYDEIIKQTNLTRAEIEEGFHFIKTLNPKPAANFEQDTIYINPEFKISVVDQAIEIQLLNDDLTITLQTDEELENQATREFLTQKKKQAQNIMNSIQKRNTTLLSIMHYMCEIQSDFFLKQGHIHHLTLEMIAKNCNLHISTISRAIANKSFEFNNTYYPLKKLLSSGGTKEVSSEEIKSFIKTMIANEDKTHPYSDETLRLLLLKDGISISRRAVAKYREQCFLYNSSKRKIRHD